MFTTSKNNFGAGEITFKDFQSPSLCILNTLFQYDPTNPDYLAAERLEIELPTNFIMRKSAMSSALLQSSVPVFHYGTVLKCWIEDRKLIIEKIPVWDEHGIITISIMSAFVTRGHRGDFEDTVKTQITEPEGVKIYQQQCVIKDEWAYFAVSFDKFPIAYQGPTHNELKFEGIPEDIECEFIFCGGEGSYNPQIFGSALLRARFENSTMIFDYDKKEGNIGNGTPFFNFFVVRDKAKNATTL